MIELYIENKKIDLAEDLQLDFTYETIDTNKLSSIKNSFSKTVNIPGTPANNITFGHIFRIDKYIPISGPTNIDNSYDPHKRINWILNKNGVLVNRGYCTLDNILVKDNENITYQLTLYGGIGEFFYSLSYNEDGTPKTLKDIWFNWKPKISMYSYGNALDAGEEAVSTLMKCSADNVAQSWHNLNPHNTYTGATDFDKDVTFVPCYSGLYEDFDSKHMIVSTFNQNYYGSTFMDTDTRNRLKASFPDSITDGEGEDAKTYYTIGRNLLHTDAYKYGKVTFSRDIDPYEAGDLRINELPVAIRLSKLMTALSNPYNNGGYTVSWDTEITTSPYWLYSWILLGKLQQPQDIYMNLSLDPNETYDGQQLILETVDHFVSAMHKEYDGAIIATGTTTYQFSSSTTSLSKGKYNLYINVYPRWEFEYRKSDNGWDYNSTRYPFISGTMKYSVSGGGSQGHVSVTSGSFRWITPILIHRIYDNGTLLKTICDIFYYTSSSTWTFGTNPRVSIGDIKTAVNNWISNNYSGLLPGETISQFNYHNCLVSNPTETLVTGGSYITCILDNQQISTTIELPSNSENLYVTEEQSIIMIGMGFTSTGPGANPSYTISEFNDTTPVNVFLVSFVRSNYNTYQTWGNPQLKYFKYSFNLNTAKENGFLTQQSSGFNILSLNKSTLFANSSAPMKYLTDFCKIMNYKFICDNTTKTITILPLKKYYIDTAIDINDKVDIGRDINMKPVVTQYKRINIGLETPDTYPVTLFNKIGESKFNTFKYDTVIEYNTSETELLNSSLYKNTLDWQQSSIFYNIYPQFPRAYDTTTISWTLFDDSNSSLDELNSKEFFTGGAPSKVSNLLANIDFLPKPALFDNSNKEKDAYPSLLFLNGFVKNYDYTLTATNYTSTLTPSSINESHYISTSGSVSSSSYQDIYIYNITDASLTYKVTCSFTSSYSSYAVNYYDSSNTRIGYEYSQTSATLVDAVLTVPSGTTSIRCNFRKTDTDAKLTVTNDFYTVSPKFMLTNDTVEQYYLAGGRCYMYDFKYSDTFSTWGSYSTDQKGTATSWAIPFFSKDLYNLYIQDVQKWEPSPYIWASWNINYQENLRSIYSLYNTTFLKNPNYSFSKQVASLNPVNSNEYSIDSFPIESEESRIYDISWKDYLKDIYNRNTRDVTLWLDLSKYSDPNQIMRQTYIWRGHKWIITKMFNYKIANVMNDRFTKVTMHKIIDIDAWT